jgi:hypothetical protein
MSIEELTKAVDEMKAQGQSEEEIAGAYYLLFRDGKIDLEQLEALVNHLGFELSEEFKAMDPEQQKEAGYEVLDEKQEEPRNSADNDEDDEDDEDEENKAMKLLGQDKKEKKEETSKPETDNDEDDEDEEDEEKKAMKFFR